MFEGTGPDIGRADPAGRRRGRFPVPYGEMPGLPLRSSAVAGGVDLSMGRTATKATSSMGSRMTVSGRRQRAARCSAGFVEAARSECGHVGSGWWPRSADHATLLPAGAAAPAEAAGQLSARPLLPGASRAPWAAKTGLARTASQAAAFLSRTADLVRTLLELAAAADPDGVLTSRQGARSVIPQRGTASALPGIVQTPFRPGTGLLPARRNWSQ